MLDQFQGNTVELWGEDLAEETEEKRNGRGSVVACDFYVVGGGGYCRYSDKGVAAECGAGVCW
jgi:hypothetical protein